MDRFMSLALAGVVSLAVVSAGCENNPSDKKHDHHHKSKDRAGTLDAADKADGKKKAHAQVKASPAPGMDDVKGEVTFKSTGSGIKVMYDITGLTPNGKHGFHIHEKGDLSDPEFKSAGGHFNPTGDGHGGPESAERHGGDLGNIKADAQGRAKGEIKVEGVSIDDPKTGIVGRSIIVHETADDLKTDPSGNSGPRVGGGKIEMMDHAHPKDAGAQLDADESGTVGADAETAAGTEAGEGDGHSSDVDANLEQPLGEKDANNPKVDPAPEDEQ